MDVDAVGVEFTDVFLQLLENFAEWLAFHGYEFGHEQAGENAVLFGHVTFDAEAAAFLAADNDRFTLHECAYVFEAHRSFVQWHTEMRGNGIDHMAGGHGAHGSAGPAAVFL